AILLDFGNHRMLGPRGRLLLDARHVLEEVGGRHVEDLGKLLQPAGADPVQTLLVFLDLLEAEIDGGPETLLAEAGQRAAGAQTRPDMCIIRVRLTHNFSLQGESSGDIMYPF